MFSRVFLVFFRPRKTRTGLCPFKESQTGVDPKMGAFPTLSPNVLFCPHMTFFCPSLGPERGTNRDKRGQTGTKRDISGQML